MKMNHVFVLMIGLSLAAVSRAEDFRPKQIGPDTTLSFDAGKSALTPEDKSLLRDVVKQARDLGKIDEIQTAVWSDNPAPRADTGLAKADQKLAERRVKSIKKYLKSSLKIADVDTYNMAERANWLARTFDTDEAQLKSEISRDTYMSKEQFQVFKDHGQPSKAVVLVILKK